MKKLVLILSLVFLCSACISPNYRDIKRQVEDDWEMLDSADFYGKYPYLDKEYRTPTNYDKKQEVTINVNIFPKQHSLFNVGYITPYKYYDLDFFRYYNSNYWLDEYMWYDWRYRQNLLYLEWLRYRMYLNDYLYKGHHPKHKYVPHKTDYFKYDNHYKKPSIRKSGSNSGANGYKSNTSNNYKSNQNDYKVVERPTQRTETRSETIGRQTQTNRTESVRTSSRSETSGNRSSSRSEINSNRSSNTGRIEVRKR